MRFGVRGVCRLRCIVYVVYRVVWLSMCGTCRVVWFGVRGVVCVEGEEFFLSSCRRGGEAFRGCRCNFSEKGWA